MNRLVMYAAASAAGYVVTRFLNELLGLEALARDVARWWRQNLPSITYSSGGA